MIQTQSEKFSAMDAVNAGLVTELMTVVIQPSDPEEPPIIPTKLSGTYKLERRLESGSFTGYQFVVIQDYLNAESEDVFIKKLWYNLLLWDKNIQQI